MSTVQTRMIVNAAGLYAQSLAHKLQGLPEETIPEQYLARGHYCTMEGQYVGKANVHSCLGHCLLNAQAFGAF